MTALSIAWKLYNRNRRSGASFNRAIFADMLRAAWVEIKRIELFKNRLFAPKPRPPVMPGDTYVSQCWDDMSRAWVDVKIQVTE